MAVPGLVASLTGLQRFMFREVISNTTNLLIDVLLTLNKWHDTNNKQMARY